MNDRFAFGWIVPPFVAVLAVVILTRSGLLGWLGISWTDLRQAIASQQEERQRLTELEAHSQVVKDRLKVKEEIAIALLHDQMTLREAMQAFYYENTHPEEYPDRFYLFFSGKTEEEQICRQVTDWARSLVDDTFPADQAEGIRRRLAADLESELSRLRSPGESSVSRGTDGSTSAALAGWQCVWE